MSNITSAESSRAIPILLSLLPIVLVVISSIPLDCVLRYESTLVHRCQCQLLLWLIVAVTASQEKNFFDSSEENAWELLLVYSWAHLTLFFAFVAILIESIPRNPGVSSSAILKFSSYKPSRVVSYLQLVAVSCCICVIYFAMSASLGNDNDPISVLLSVQVFGVTLLVLAFVRWHILRKQRINQDYFSPVATNTTMERNLGCFCSPREFAASQNGSALSLPIMFPRQDERHWYNWDRIQTLDWLSQQLQPLVVLSSTTGSFSTSSLPTGVVEKEELKERDMILSTLVSHYITGSELDAMADISNVMLLKIPFGPACRLSRAIQRLVHQHPKPWSLDPADQHEQTNMVSNSESWIDRHDMEFYSKPYRPTATSLHTHKSVDNERHPHSTKQGSSGLSSHKERSSDDIYDRMNGVMKEQFGLELPKINQEAPPEFLSRDPLPLSQKDCQSSSKQDSVSTIHVSNPPNMVESAPTVQETLSLGILERMPPHIQEIASKRPELVKQLLEQKQHPLRLKPQQHIISHQPSPQLQSHNTTHVMGKSVAKAEGQNDEDEDSVNSDNDDETTTLIHPDQSEIRYRSINKAA